MLITITGASGTGKTTTIKRLLVEIPRAHLLRSGTTRAPRPSDASGEYLYLTPKEFDERVAAGAFAWHTSFRGESYGTLRDDFRNALASDDPFFAAIVPVIVPKIHEIAAAESLAKRVRSIYIKPPDAATLLRRMVVERGETEEAARKKIAECAEWNKIALNSRHYFYVADRDDFDEKYHHVLDLVNRPW